MSSKFVYVTIYKDKIETSTKDNVLHTYFLKEFKFNEDGQNDLVTISTDIFQELYELQDLGYEIIIRYKKD